MNGKDYVGAAGLVVNVRIPNRFVGGTELDETHCGGKIITNSNGQVLDDSALNLEIFSSRLQQIIDLFAIDLIVRDGYSASMGVASLV
jgi:hypothetical protein